MADAFEDRLDNCYAQLAELGENGSFENGKRLQVPAENRYVGFDAYRKVIDSGVDVDRSRDAAGLPAGTLRVRGRTGQACVHGEAGRRRRARCAASAQGGQGGQGEGPQGRRRPAASPQHDVQRDDRPHPRRRDRRRRGASRLLERLRRLGAGPQARPDRDGVPDAQLVLLQLALRRPHRRAAHPQHRRRQLGQGRAPGGGSGPGRPPVAERSRPRGDLRPPLRRVHLRRRCGHAEPVPAHPELLGPGRRVRARQQGPGEPRCRPDRGGRAAGPTASRRTRRARTRSSTIACSRRSARTSPSTRRRTARSPR